MSSTAGAGSTGTLSTRENEFLVRAEAAEALVAHLREKLQQVGPDIRLWVALAATSSTEAERETAYNGLRAIADHLFGLSAVPQDGQG